MDGLLIALAMLMAYALGRRHERKLFVTETRRALARRMGLTAARGDGGLR